MATLSPHGLIPHISALPALKGHFFCQMALIFYTLSHIYVEIFLRLPMFLEFPISRYFCMKKNSISISKDWNHNSKTGSTFHNDR